MTGIAGPAESSATCSILSLPYEIIDIIISYATDSPNDHMHNVKKCQAAAANLFRNPLMRVCSLLRKRYLHILSVRHVWIRLRLRVNRMRDHAWDEYVDGRNEGFPLISESHLSDLDGTWSIVDLVSYPLNVSGLDNRWTEELLLTFPFNFASFCRVLDFLRRNRSKKPHALSVSTTSSARHMIELLRTRIIPMTLLQIYPGWTVTLGVPETAISSHDIADRATVQCHSVRDFFAAVTRYIQFADQLEAKGQVTESGLWLLHHHWFCFYLRDKFLREANLIDWTHRDSDPDMYHSEDEVPPSPQRSRRRSQQMLNIIGNEILDSMNTLGCRAASSFMCFWKKFGLEWFDDNYGVLLSLWPFIDSFLGLPFELFPLSTEQLARRIFTRRCSGLILERYILIRRARNQPSPHLAQQISNFNTLPPLIDETANDTKIIRATVVAHLMQPSNAEYAQALRELHEKCGSERVEQVVRFNQDLIARVYDEQGQELWAGPKEILLLFNKTSQSAEETIRKYHTRARRRLPRPIDPRELQGIDRDR